MPVLFVRHSEVDVLIIGAGPAGLMRANALTNVRVNVHIVDQRSVGRPFHSCFQLNVSLGPQK
ncbi:uncharacterized protein HD556DRAFT_1380752 [Suillus plorans]|uniref:FAD-binding domain-containing protein n=1 Tax=Suillus plorans TaxID=116603 RepID=A0A9P7ANY1_9AGAM|nr:uncharacterized protein HD556DRAFT_1380752 [Suillus plorans]KAG1792350.1 hypothetical protein HD556DRAFT_1380752 [Suillus plorans]